MASDRPEVGRWRRAVARRIRRRLSSSAAIGAWTRGELGMWALRGTCHRLGLASGPFAYDLGLVERPQYAYGVRQATALARRLGFGGTTVVELGVAGGMGLLALEEHARHYSKRTGCEVSVVGFDLGTGLPRPSDYRDLPYLWSEGFFVMDEPALRAALRDAKLVIGDIRDTLPRFLADHQELATERPIGFVAFDLDYWSSTSAALQLFRDELAPLLPRVQCFFDDLIYKVAPVGPMLAIAEFNSEFSDRHIGHPFGLRGGLPFQPSWADRIYEAHLFSHSLYSVLVDREQQRPLAPALPAERPTRRPSPAGAGSLGSRGAR